MLRRDIDRWKAADAYSLAYSQSDTAKHYAFDDAIADILTLHQSLEKLKEIARMVAYPRRGSAEESLGIMDVAKMIQSAYSSEDLWNDIAQRKTEQQDSFDNVGPIYGFYSKKK